MQIDNLIKINLPSPSGALNNKQTKAKIESLLSLIDSTNYTTTFYEDFFILSHKNLNKTKKYITISSHIDTVYENFFFKIEGDNIIGTNDNSITNFIASELMNTNISPQVVFIFSNKEEKGLCPFINLELLKTKFFRFNICLDVTPFCHHTHFATVENDKFCIGKKLTKNTGIAYIHLYQSLNDEAKILNKNNIKSFSYCIPSLYEENNCHSKNGGQVSLSAMQSYYSALYNFLNKFL